MIEIYQKDYERVWKYRENEEMKRTNMENN